LDQTGFDKSDEQGNPARFFKFIKVLIPPAYVENVAVGASVATANGHFCPFCDND
jgi:hypothetical protein